MSKKPFILAILALMAPVGELSAQERFRDMIAVTEVEVPVRVLVKGKPVAGLTVDDFEIYDDGAQQTIIGFEARDLWASAPEGRKPKAKPGVMPEDAIRRRLLLLFDFSFSRRQRLAWALRGLRSSLERQLAPSDRVAVATYGAVSGLNLLVGFTDDRRQVDLALDAIQAMLDAKRKRQRELLGDLHEIRFAQTDVPRDSSTYAVLAAELSPAAALAILSGPVVYDEAKDGGVVVEQQESFWGPIKVRVEVDVTQPIDVAQDMIDRDADASTIRAFGLALTELVYLLRGVGGQKDMLLLSEGFGGSLLQDARSLFFLQKSFRAFRDSGWTLHALDVGGIPGLGEQGFASDSLLFMADATGGDLIENINDFSVAAAKVLQRTGIVYVLSFQPSVEGDEGAFRELEVRLKDPLKGAEIIHRPGYYWMRPLGERDVFEQRADAAEWLLTNVESAELGVEVFAETALDPLGGMRVPVAIEVDGPSLLTAGTRKSEKLELQLVALGPRMQIEEILSAEAEVDFRALEGVLRQGGVRFVGELGLASGEYQLRVLVRVRQQERVFLATYPLTVGAGVEAESSLSLLPPPEDRPANQWVTVEAASRAAYFQ